MPWAPVAADRSFTLRAVVIGLSVGALGAVSNVYVSLKAGWSLPVMTTAAVVGAAFARARGSALGAREAAALTSLASAAGFMTGGGNVAAIPALVMLGGEAPSPLMMTVWFATLAILGTLMAPLFEGRVRTLEFPTASATSVVLETLHDSTATQQPVARSLAIGAGTASVAAGVRAIARIPATLSAPGVAGLYTFGVDTSLLLVGIGGLMTRKTAWSTLVGGTVTYGIIAPALVAKGIVATPTYRSIVAQMVWAAAGVLVSSALVELLVDAPSLLAKSVPENADRPALSLTVAGRASRFVLAVPAIATVLLAHGLFALSWLVAAGSLVIALVFAYVAARSMGETDVVPTKALAPVAQGTFALAEAGIVPPTIAPNISGAAAIHAADTLGALRVAARLGAPARIVLVARSAGAIVGAIVVVLTYRAIVPDARALPTSELPSPGILVWMSVSEALAVGALPSATRTAIEAGTAVGVGLVLLDRLLPPRARRWVPSAMGIGSGMVLPASSAVAIAIGAASRISCERRYGVEHATALAAGAIAADSLVGVAVQLLTTIAHT